MAQLTFGATYGFSDLSVLELNSLSSKPNQTSPAVEPQIVAQNLILTASKGAGLVNQQTVISITDIQNQTLTASQRSALAYATGPGQSLQMVGTDSNGLIVAYTYGDTPSGVTPIGVQVPLDVPLFIDLPAYGTLSVAGSQVSVVEVSGNLNVVSAVSTGAMHLEADGTVTTAPTQLGTLSGFNTDGTGWTTNTNSPTSSGGFTATVDNNVLQLTDSGIDSNANAIWFDTAQALVYGFVVNFTYTATEDGADGIAFVVQNAVEGTAALGSAAEGLGYAGIGNSLAVGIDIFQGGLALGLDGTLGPVESVGLNPGSGDPLEVTIVYNAASETVTVQLYDSKSNVSGFKTYTQVDLAQLLGSESGWIGFTGATGEISATQTISSFRLSLGAAVVNNIPEITQIGTPGSDAWVPVQNGTGYTPTVSNNVLTLTGTGDESGSSAAWFGQPVSTMAAFEANFTYAGQTDSTANDYPDGCAFVIQNNSQATNAVGSNSQAWQVGAALPDNSFAVVLLVNTDSLGEGTSTYPKGAIYLMHNQQRLVSPVSTGAVELGWHPVTVTLQYNPATQTLSYTLTDTVNGDQSKGSFTGIEIASLVESETALLGFTGSNTNTGTTANQTISDFSFVSNVIQAGSLDITAGGNVGQSASAPLPLNVSGTVNLYGNEIWISQASGTLTLGQVEAEGDVTITTGGDLAAATQIAQGSIGGFSGNGSGWTVHGSASLGAAVNPPDTVLQLVNGTAASEVGAAWEPSPVLWQNGFSTGFIINPIGSATGLGLTLTLQNDPRTTAAIGGTGSTLGTDGTTPIQNSVSLQFLLGDAGLTVGLGTNGETFNIVQQTLSSYNPADPLQVVVTYNPNGTSGGGSSDTLLVTLVNTTTGATSQSYFNPTVHLLQVLGQATAYLGMTGASTTAASLSVSNFYYSYGGANIVAANLDIQSGGSVGASSQPLVIQIPDAGTVNMTATDNVTLLALGGDLNVGTITAGGTATLLAPDGSVVASSGTQASGASGASA
ncbi:MAG: hypothetical protein ACK5V1_14160, partial [Planctomycetaceae bacterium]